MVWLVVFLAPCVAVVARLCTLRSRPEVWWWSFTLALVGILAGALLLVDEAGINSFLGVPNMAYLLSCLSFFLAAGSVTIYVHTLRCDQPSRKVMWSITIATATGCLVLIGLWAVAPIHAEDVGRFRRIPLSSSLVAFEWVFHLLFIPVLANVARCSYVLIGHTPPGDPARRAGLWFVTVSSSLDVAAHLLYLLRASLQATIGESALRVAAVADLVTLLAVAGICIGTMALVLIPQLLPLLRARQLTWILGPLWRRTLELYPEVALRGGWRVRGRAALQAERMLIEIADALRLLPVPDSGATDPYRVIAEAFRHPAKGVRYAADALPTPTSRLEEEEQMLKLAHYYRNKSIYAS